jgi:hypothetical protein
MIMEYTHDEYSNMILTLDSYNSRAGTAEREYALRYPDPNVLPRLEQRLRETGNVRPTAKVNEGRPWTPRTPANAGDVSTTVELEPWESSRELGLSHLRVLETLRDDELHPYHYSRRAHLFPDDRPLRMKFWE